ncbi:MAG TPA: chromosome partitioning protein ParB, partial [Terriglobia bacterium]
ILGLTRAEEQKLAADRVIKQSLNVRQTETLVAHLQNRSTAPPAGTRPASLPLTKDSHIADLERRLQERFGTKVDLRYRQGKGALQIHFYNDDDLGRVLEIMNVKLD